MEPEIGDIAEITLKEGGKLLGYITKLNKRYAYVTIQGYRQAPPVRISLRKLRILR